MCLVDDAKNLVTLLKLVRGQRWRHWLPVKQKTTHTTVGEHSFLIAPTHMQQYTDTSTNDSALQCTHHSCTLTANSPIVSR